MALLPLCQAVLILKKQLRRSEEDAKVEAEHYKRQQQSDQQVSVKAVSVTTCDVSVPSLQAISDLTAQLDTADGNIRSLVSQLDATRTELEAAVCVHVAGLPSIVLSPSRFGVAVCADGRVVLVQA